ncbi:hypothetical protein HK105_208406 [Polyrhizophydium stewartii]|uniref:Phytocyanin domain-containing protein n=1 Tax=Polyrhizophydium stewartii TaxID=2732419 RepID=A0ABR4MXZ1_9FUNG
MRSAGLLVLGAAAAAAAPQEWIIHSQNRAFQPAVTTIRLGDSVTFVFETARRIVETVRDSCDQSKRGLDTGTQAVNATLTFKPSVTGTFYFTSASKGASDCNDGMKGILVVAAAETATTTQAKKPSAAATSPAKELSDTAASRPTPAPPPAGASSTNDDTAVAASAASLALAAAVASAAMLLPVSQVGRNPRNPSGTPEPDTFGARLSLGDDFMAPAAAHPAQPPAARRPTAHQRSPSECALRRTAPRRAAATQDRTASRRVLALAAATLSLAATASAAPQRWTIHSNLQSFQPKVTTILSGDTVTFVMDGTHQIYQTANSTSCDYNGGFDTGLRESNSLVNMTFTRPGTYFFSSSYSVNCLAGQRGTLIVQSLAGSTNPTSTSRTPTVSATAAAEGDGSSRGTGQNSDTTSTSTFLGFSPLAKSTQVIQNGAHAQARVAGQSAFAASAAVAVASALMSLFL